MLSKAEKEYADDVVNDIRAGKYTFESFEDFFVNEYEYYVGGDWYVQNPEVLDYVKAKLFGGAS